MPSEPAPAPGSACSGRAGAAGARGHAHHRPAGRREGGKEGGRRQPRARSREGGGGSAGAGPGTPVPLPRRTRRGRGEARVSRPAGKLSGGGRKPGRKLPPLRPKEPESGRPSPGGQGLRPRGGKLLRDDLSPAVFQRQPQSCSAHERERIPVGFLLGSGTGTPI